MWILLIFIPATILTGSLAKPFVDALVSRGASIPLATVSVTAVLLIPLSFLFLHYLGIYTLPQLQADVTAELISGQVQYSSLTPDMQIQVQEMLRHPVQNVDLIFIDSIRSGEVAYVIERQRYKLPILHAITIGLFGAILTIAGIHRNYYSNESEHNSKTQVSNQSISRNTTQ